MRTMINVLGLRCLSCKILIEDIVMDMPGVKGVNVDLGNGRVTIKHDSDTDLALIKAEIEKTGEYKVEGV